MAFEKPPKGGQIYNNITLLYTLHFLFLDSHTEWKENHKQHENRHEDHKEFSMNFVKIHACHAFGR